MSDEPETKHLSAEVLRLQLQKLRAGEPATRFDRPWSLKPLGTQGRGKADRFSSAVADATATSIDADLFAELRKPSVGHLHVISDTHDTLTWSRVPQHQHAPTEAKLTTECMRLYFSRWQVWALRIALGCVAAGIAWWVAVGAPPPLSTALVNAQRPLVPPAVAKAAQPAEPPPHANRSRSAAASPAASASASASASPSPPATTPSSRNAPSPKGEGTASARAAVDALLSGRTRAALDAYRALAAQPRAAPEAARVVDLLERELRACSKQEGAACAR